MRWNIIVECVGEDGQQSTITLGTIERLAASTTAENLGVNLRESKQIANRLQDPVVKQQLHEIVNKGGNQQRGSKPYASHAGKAGLAARQISLWPIPQRSSQSSLRSTLKPNKRGVI